MSEEKKTLRVSQEYYDQVSKYAEKRGLELTEAAEALLGSGIKRINAINRYAKKCRKARVTGETAAPKKKAAAPKKKTAAKKKAAEAPAEKAA